MFQEDLDAEARLAVAKGLRGRVVVTLAQDCAREGDLAGLRALHAAGHFDFGMAEMLEDDFFSSRLVRRHPLGSREAVPMIDALLGVLDRTEWTSRSFDAGRGADVASVCGEYLVLRHEPELHAFVRERFFHACERMEALASITSSERRLKTTQATAAVIAAFAAATGDQALMQRAFAQHESARDFMLHGEMLKELGHGQSLNSIGVAVVFARMGLLDALGDAVVRHPVGRRGNSDGTGGEIRAIDLVDAGVRQRSQPVQPELLAWVLERMARCEPGNDTAGFQSRVWQVSGPSWIQNLYGGEWSHARQLVEQQVPALLKIGCGGAIAFSVQAGLRDLAQDLVARWEGPGLPESTAFAMLPSEHPIVGILDFVARRPSEAPSADEAMQLVLQKLQARGELEELQGPLLQLGGEPVFGIRNALVRASLNASIVYLSGLGWDFHSRDPEGRRPKDYVHPERGAGTASLLQSLAARQQALDALGNPASPNP